MVSLRRHARDWRLYAAAGVAVCVLYGEHAHANGHATKVNRDHHAPAKQSNAAPTVPVKEPYHFPTKCDQPQSAEEANLCLERRSAEAAERGAEWTKNTAIIGAGGTIAVVLTLMATAWAAFAAHRSAKAAERAVETLPIIERAHVYPEIVSPGDIDRLLREARVYYMDGLDSYDTPVPETDEVTFRLKNFGKTPAVLKAVYADVCIGRSTAQIGLSIPQGVLGDKETTDPLICKMQIGFTRNQAVHVGVHTAHVAFSGLIIFEDIWGVEHQTEFYFMWDQEIRNFVLKDVRTKAADQQS